MPVIVRTHGGLGNQIFQVLYGRLYAEKKALILKEVHDASYYHKFPRGNAPAVSEFELTRLERFISASRLPKLITKARLRTEGPIWVLGGAYLDGYFQEVSSYSGFDNDAIRRHLQCLSEEMRIMPASKDQTLVHLRLGDFFKSVQEAKLHAHSRLEEVEDNSVIMTNDEGLLQDAAIVDILDRKSCKVLPTKGMAAEDVLRHMAEYQRINANESTLAFWSSVLGGCDVKIEHRRLKPTLERFRELYQPRKGR